jgi:pyruvate dehydrogenase E2 component (dihydrolipoamide acetyltransferase)
LIPASPKARRLAQESGIRLEALAGSGPDKAILAADVMAYRSVEIAAAPVVAQPSEMSRAWRVMAERLSAGWSSVPHFYLMREVDVSEFKTWRDRAQKRIGHKVTYTDLLVRVVASALRHHPQVNGSWGENGIVTNTDVNIGLAVAVENGLLVPVIHHVDTLGLAAIAGRRQELVERAMAGKLRLDDLQGGTFTISNLGMYGVDAFNAIVNPPEAAILAVGRIADRVVPIDGQPVIRPMIVITLSCDHRVIDGARGAQFLEEVASLIEAPMRLVE